ncbi:MAG: penicillin-binding protein 2 [Nitrospirota bacterium]|nr:penicillin-binding protein 2 [Nitrospirota bacterium]
MKRRTTISVIFVIIGFAIIVGRLVDIQILNYPLYQRLSLMERERLAPIEGARGVIYSSDGRPLADNRMITSLAADPMQVRKSASPYLFAERLAPVLGLQPSILRKKVTEKKHFVWIKHGITPSEKKVVGRRIRGLYELQEKKRFYPFGTIFRSVIGSVSNDGSGISGLEKGYDAFLKGKRGNIVREVSARGRSYFQTESVNPDSLAGNNIETTLVSSLQQYAQDALDEEIRSVDAQGGIVLVMDPRTGAVLALASHLSGRWTGVNPGVSLVYEPGSIFKLVTASAALNENKVSLDDTFFCYNGAMPIPGGVLHDAEPLGTLTLGGILEHSSNIGISQVAVRLGPSLFEQYIRRFGFGSRTMIDLPGESSGFFKSRSRWSRRSLYTISMGQEIGVTPVQLVTAVSAIANGGRLMRPYLVSRILDPKGNVLMEHHPVEVRRVISATTARKLMALLTSVVSPSGTGAKAAIAGFDIAGKTGTAEVYDPLKHSYSRTKTVDSFVGIVPEDHPAFVVLVVVIQPKGVSWGGTVAAPLFRKVAEMALVHFRIHPSVPVGGVVARADISGIH